MARNQLSYTVFSAICRSDSLFSAMIVLDRLGSVGFIALNRFDVSRHERLHRLRLTFASAILLREPSLIKRTRHAQQRQRTHPT